MQNAGNSRKNRVGGRPQNRYNPSGSIQSRMVTQMRGSPKIDRSSTSKVESAQVPPVPTAAAGPTTRCRRQRLGRVAAASPGHRPVDGRQPARHLCQRVLRKKPAPAGLRQSAQGPADHRQGGGRQRPGRLRRGRHPAGNLGPHPTHRARTATRSACKTTAPASSRSKSR